jgi:hypothetical protein
LATVFNKNISVSIDLEKLQDQLEQQREDPDYLEDEEMTARSSVIMLGNDPRIAQQHLSTPELTYIEILKDGLHNPYLQINWQLKREDIDSGQIRYFEVYRRLKRPEDSPSFLTIDSLDRDAFESLAIKSKKVGKFSEEKKPISNIKRGLINLSNLNHNLYLEEKQTEINSYLISNKSVSGYTNPFYNNLSNYNYKKIATVDYTSFLAQERKKFLSVTDRNIATLYYRDKSIGFGDTYEYYIVAVTKQLGKNTTSNSALVTVEDFTPPHAPTAVSVKQTKETEVQVSVSFNRSSKPSRILIYKKSENIVSYAFVGELQIKGESLIFTDSDILYGKNYSYRIFVQNIHGIISDPTQVDFFSSVHKVTAESKFNNLKIPILSAVQDQNSDFIKISIFPNDALIAYYLLERRDMTNKEKKFISPSKDTNGYGGDGWINNKLFVTKTYEDIQSAPGNSFSKVIFDQILFLDDTVQVDHIYQYRIRGYDLFGNGSSYSFALASTSGKKSVRNPINVRREVLRGFPLRYKVLWDDDNVVANLQQKDPFTETTIKASIIYRVQRRKIGENVYETFPLTSNNFIVDEVVSADPVDFENQRLPSSQFFRESSLDVTEEEYEETSRLRRAFGMPNFVLEGDTYFYRIIALNKAGEQSNATEEFKITAISELSEPIDFGVESLNTKVRPLIIRLFWDVDSTKAFPDYWTIERKADTSNEDFRQIGNSYIQLQYFDFNVDPGHTYVYRIRSYDSIGRVSDSVEARISL